MIRRPTIGVAGILAAATLLALPAALTAQSGDDPFAIVHYDLTANLDGEVHMVRARAKMKLVAFEPLASVTLYLNRRMRINRITDDRGREMLFERVMRATSFLVELPRTIPVGESFTLVVDYNGAFDPALNKEGDDVTGLISTEVSYLLPESRWFPRSRNPWQRYTMNVTITPPPGHVVISSGQAETSGGKSTFRTTEPSFGGAVVTGKFDTGEDVEGNFRFRLRTVPSGYASSNAGRVSEILSFFTETFGELGSGDISIVEIPDDVMQAYSAPGLALIPAREWREDMSSRMLARTLASQWWQSVVAPASEADVWLADGLARYSEALFALHSNGEDAFRQALEDMTIGALVDESAAAIGNADRLQRGTPEHRSVVRDKGAMVWHMLRRVMGEEKFGEVLRAYATQFAGQSVSIDQFERFAEENGGEPLDYFFGQWIRSTGIPEFELEYVIFRVMTPEGGRFRINGAIKNTLEIFRMPVEIRVSTEGPPHSQVVEVAGSSSDFIIETFGKPLPPIRIDPDFDVLKYTPDLRLRVAIARGEAMFERGDYFESIREYQEAIKIKRDSSLAHYRLGETFFSQRNYQSAANAFREAEAGDREPKWTKVWSHINLGKIFDVTGQRERAVNEYRKAIATKDDTAGALAEARQYLRDPYRRESRRLQNLGDTRGRKIGKQSKPDDPEEAQEDPPEEEPPAEL